MLKNKFFLLFIFFSTFCYSQNDLCANAISLTPNQTCVTTPVSFSGATLDGPTSTPCSPNSSQDIWYKFVATDKMMRIFITGVSDVSNAFEVYENNCAGNRIICQNTNANGVGESLYYNNFSIGAEYIIRVINAYSNLSVSNFTICVQNFPAPNNDLCANAISLTPNQTCVTTPVSFSGATLDGPSSTPCSPNTSQDLWYKFIATDKMMRIFISGVSDVSNAFEVYENNCAGNRIICQNTNANGVGESLYYNNFSIGTEYIIRVINAYSNLSVSNFTICVQNYPAPNNDLCANAITLTPNQTCVTTPVTFSGATLDGPTSTPCSPNSSQDIWYKFVATNTSMTIKITSVSDVSNALEVYENNCAGNRIICQNTNANGVGETSNYSNFIVGNDYFIRVTNAYNTLSISNFTICVIDTTLSNDEFIKNQLEIFPNPTNNVLYLKHNQDIKKIELYNSVGELMLIGDNKTQEIDLQSLNSGLYFIKFIYEKGFENKKIIKK